MKSTSSRRPAFTLTELAVALAVITFLASLTALTLPGLFRDNHLHRGDDLLQQWLLEAKGLAMRDRKPTGLRFNVGPDGTCRTMSLVQEPDPVGDGMYVGYKPQTVTEGPVAYFQLRWRNGKEDAFDDPNGPVRVGVGDWIIITTLPPRRVTEVGPQWLRFGLTPTSYNRYDDKGILHVEPVAPPVMAGKEYASPPPHYPGNPEAFKDADNARTNWKAVRAPDVLPGQPDYTLPEGIFLNFSAATAGSRGILLSSGKAELLFSPQGSLCGAGTGSAQVVLWITDGKGALLVAVQPRTGFVASHPVASGDDPYLFTEDARSSGM